MAVIDKLLICYGETSGLLFTLFKINCNIRCIETPFEDILGRNGGQFKCDVAANALAAELTKRGQQFQFAEMQFDTMYVFSRSNPSIFTPSIEGFPGVVSRNGYHIGVLINGRVHCNVHPLGLPIESWFRDFESPGLQRRHIGNRPLGPMNPIWMTISPTF